MQCIQVVGGINNEEWEGLHLKEVLKGKDFECYPWNPTDLMFNRVEFCASNRTQKSALKKGYTLSAPTVYDNICSFQPKLVRQCQDRDVLMGPISRVNFSP